jgi:L-ascorbate metabolism protein UlaG (beta-lactamase superfamily)
MKSSSIVLGCVLATSAFAARNVEEFKTAAGTLKITTIMHAGFEIEAGGQVVIVDPAQGSWDGIPQADLILITDIHGDHLNPSMIVKVKKADGMVIAPEAVARTLTEAQILRNGETKTIGAWKIEAVPMYNLKRGPSE